MKQLMKGDADQLQMPGIVGAGRAAPSARSGAVGRSDAATPICCPTNLCRTQAYGQSIMRLYLIRHGETVDNVAQVYAGVKDSALTIHGSLQAERLARHLAAIGVRPTRIFSSDLQRAYKTAEAIRLEQLKLKKDANFDLAVTELSILREQDFGFYEGKPFQAKPRELNRSNHRSEHQNSPGFKDVESKEAMAKRMNSFLEQFIIPCLQETISEPEPVFVIVSHGMILSTLWKCLLKRSASQNVRLGNGLEMKSGSATLEHIGAWSNTGYMLLDVHLLAQSAPTARATAGNTAVEARQIKATIVHDLRIVIKAVNSKDHLRGLKRTGGGVGSSKFDEGQKKIESFFKKRRV